MATLFSLREPIPKGIYKRAALFPFRYLDFPVFSWPWFRHRAKIFLFGIFLLVLFIGYLSASGLQNLRIGIVGAALNGIPSVICILLGPALAASVRARGFDYLKERRLIVAAIVVSVILGMAVGVLIYIKEYDYFAAEMAARGLGGPNQNRQLEYHVFNFVTGGLTLIWFSGAFALREHSHEYRFWRDYQRNQEIELLRRQREEADRKLAILQAQVEPHFLYNTLASLRSLIRTDPQRAETTIDALVDHLRSTLPKIRNSDSAPTFLGDQLEVCRSYLDLMRIRTGGRMSYAIDAAPDVKELAFPPLILIPLVENAVKHGVEPKSGPCSIGISARRIGGFLEVIVTDDGAGLREGPSEGVGLANVRAQLATRYKGKASLELFGREGGGVVACLRIPVESDVT